MKNEHKEIKTAPGFREIIKDYSQDPNEVPTLDGIFKMLENAVVEPPSEKHRRLFGYVGKLLRPIPTKDLDPEQ